MSSNRQSKNFNSSQFPFGNTKQEQTKDNKGNRLNATNRLLCAILNNTTALVVNLDTKFNFIFVNKAYANACNLPIDFFREKIILNYIHTKKTKKFFKE